MKFENYNTADISIIQDVPRGGCTVGFKPLLCACARARVCVCVCARVHACVRE